MNSIFTEENLLAFTTAARFGSFSKAAAEQGGHHLGHQLHHQADGNRAGRGAVCA